MLVFTHLMFANYFVQEYQDLQNGVFPLNFVGFRLGNILPDISKMSLKNHYLEEIDCFVDTYKERVSNKTLSSWERSIALGVLCHFYCDYFCRYHHFNDLQKKSIIIHLFYELKLHLVFAHNSLKRKWLGLSSASLEKQITDLNWINYQTMALFHNKESGNRLSFHESLFFLYKNHSQSITTDLTFGLLASKYLLSKHLNIVLSPKSNELVHSFVCDIIPYNEPSDLVLG